MQTGHWLYRGNDSVTGGDKMRLDKDTVRLYALVGCFCQTEPFNGQEDPLFEQVEKAILGGVTFVQFLKKKVHTKNFLMEARQIRILCQQYHIPFVITGREEIAMAVDADGVHFGQVGRNLLGVRHRIGNEKIIGVTVKTAEQARCAQEYGADYISVDTAFPLFGQENPEWVPHSILAEICGAVSIPVVATGEFQSENILELKDIGVDGIAVSSALFQQKDITEAARLLREKVEGIIK